MLGPGNEAAAKEALSAWPDGMQIGGGINDRNAREWIENGAERVFFPPIINLQKQQYLLTEIQQ